MSSCKNTYYITENTQPWFLIPKFAIPRNKPLKGFTDEWIVQDSFPKVKIVSLTGIKGMKNQLITSYSKTAETKIICTVLYTFLRKSRKCWFTYHLIQSGTIPSTGRNTTRSMWKMWKRTIYSEICSVNKTLADSSWQYQSI